MTIPIKIGKESLPPPDERVDLSELFDEIEDLKADYYTLHGRVFRRERKQLRQKINFLVNKFNKLIKHDGLRKI